MRSSCGRRACSSTRGQRARNHKFNVFLLVRRNLCHLKRLQTIPVSRVKSVGPLGLPGFAFVQPSRQSFVRHLNITINDDSVGLSLDLNGSGFDRVLVIRASRLQRGQCKRLLVASRSTRTPDTNISPVSLLHLITLTHGHLYLTVQNVCNVSRGEEPSHCD